MNLVIRFNPDIEAVQRDGQRITLTVKDWKPIVFAARTPLLADTIMALQDDGATRDRLADLAGGDVAGVDYYLERFAFGRLLEWRAVEDGEALATFIAQANRIAPRGETQPAGPVRASRFALLRRDGDGAVLESGAVPCRVTLSERGAARCAALFAREAVVGDDFAGILWRMGFMDRTDEAESETRRTWEFHDLLMHQRSRMNRDATLLGGTYRFTEEFPSQPAMKPEMTGERVVLPEIDPDAIATSSQPLDRVIAARRSRRDYDDQPLTLVDLGTFLHRVCRTIDVLKDRRQDLLSRPYPAGGSINELEYYLAVRRCDGLDPGFYHYEGLHHRLVRLAAPPATLDRIVTASATSMGQPDKPGDVVVVIASRFPRLAWKYEAMAYRATLMNAGVVFQTMYLVATDMGLAPCANGSGDSRLFAAATGLDPFEETSIAEFVLGRPAVPVR